MLVSPQFNAGRVKELIPPALLAESSRNFSKQLELITVTRGIMAKPTQPKILAAMPAYNEEKYIGSMVLRARQYADDVLVIDD